MSDSHKFGVDAFAKQVFGLCVAATKASNCLPDDREQLLACAAQLSTLQTRLARLMQHTGTKRRKGEFLVKSGSSNDQMFDAVVDAVDEWLESVDRTVDRLSGLSTAVSALTVSKEVLTAKQTPVIRAANVLRPQLRFVPPVDNSAAVAFVPHLQDKPNAIAPLDEMFKPSNLIAGRELESAISSAMRGHLTSRLSSGGSSVVPNPYEPELQALKYLPEQLKGPQLERIYRKLDDTPCEWIDKVSALEILVGKLLQEKEIAIDLEQHFFRSYQGFVCLMQLSTRTQNFLIDTLELRSSMQKLNVVFTNPSIVKVLHGADFDIQWLQRDFGLFVVNMFDTGQAARVLDYQKKSLAFLLDKFCSVQANKQYQLADWRIRPLPKEMERYAIEDTHYLLYVYDRLRSELAAKSHEGNNLILNVLNRSRELCLQVYQKPPPVNEKSHEEIFEKLRVEPLIGTSLEALKELYQWRDDLARQEDESPSFVLPNRMLLSVCENLPVTTEQLLALCVPVPPLVRAYAHEITAIIHRVRSGVGKAGAARGGYYAIAALLKPKHEEELKLQQQQQKQILAAPQGPFELPVAEAPKPQLHPANRGGAVEGGLFAAAAAQGARQQRKDKVSAALEVIGQSFDPMFASRVAAAFGDDIDEGEVEAEQQTEAPAATAAVSSINEFPKSLAEVHKLSKGQRKRKNKRAAAAAAASSGGKPASPLDYSKLGTSIHTPLDVDADEPDQYSKVIAPVPSGRNRLEEQPASEKKSKKREDATQGFNVTSSVAPAKKPKKEQSGQQTFFLK